MDERIFIEEQTTNGFWGKNESALRQLNENWTFIEGENYGDNRVNWLFVVTINADSFKSLNLANVANNKIANTLTERLYIKDDGREDLSIHCIMYMVSANEINMLVGIYGFNIYTKKEIEQLCIDRLQLKKDYSIKINYLYDKKGYNLYLSHLNAIMNNK